MNEKLTSEQIIEKIINCNTHFEIEQIEAIRQILTALTAEDVCAECGGRGWIGRPPHVALYDTTCPQCQTDAIYCRHSTAKQQGG